MFEVEISEDDIPIKWMFKNAGIKESEHYSLTSELKYHKLTIHNVDASKEGEYTAMVGHVHCSARLTVEGRCQHCVTC